MAMEWVKIQWLDSGNSHRMYRRQDPDKFEDQEGHYPERQLHHHCLHQGRLHRKYRHRLSPARHWKSKGCRQAMEQVMQPWSDFVSSHHMCRCQGPDRPEDQGDWYLKHQLHRHYHHQCHQNYRRRRHQSPIRRQLLKECKLTMESVKMNLRDFVSSHRSRRYQDPDKFEDQASRCPNHLKYCHCRRPDRLCCIHRRHLYQFRHWCQKECMQSMVSVKMSCMDSGNSRHRCRCLYPDRSADQEDHHPRRSTLRHCQYLYRLNHRCRRRRYQDRHQRLTEYKQTTVWEMQLRSDSGNNHRRYHCQCPDRSGDQWNLCPFRLKLRRCRHQRHRHRIDRHHPGRARHWRVPECIKPMV